MVQTLQRVAEPYGLYLNRDKCEVISFHSDQEVWMLEGKIKKVPEAKMLGCKLNNAADPMREIKGRIAAAMT
eukprot:4264252-Prorocentrum_lima.AAC.1